MRRHLPALLLASLWWLTIAPSPAAPHPDWDQVVPGIEYQAFTLEGPNRAFVVRMDRHNPALTLDSAIASGSLLDGKETVSQMAARYDQAINGWGSVWGKRNRVVAAINGSLGWSRAMGSVISVSRRRASATQGSTAPTHGAAS